VQDRVEFIYDREYSWFKVSCRQDEEHAIRLHFCSLARGFEDEAFGDSEDDLLSLDGFLEVGDSIIGGRNVANPLTLNSHLLKTSGLVKMPYLSTLAKLMSCTVAPGPWPTTPTSSFGMILTRATSLMHAGKS
jgi:hypothetical protein